jgi:nucleoid-associated protein YgaU
MPEVFVGNITCEEGSHKDQKVEFHFNPGELTVTKANKYNPSANKGGNVPSWEFSGGNPRTVSLALLFDASIPREDNRGQAVQEADVRTAINKLFDFMLVDDTLKQQDGRDSHMGRPPQCRLQWARDTKYHFRCYIASCVAQYIMFNQDGAPIRATASLVLHEALDSKQLGGTNPTSRGELGPRARQLQEGDRLDWIAYQEYGDPNEWRLIAEANRLFDPLDLRPGMVLTIPAR